MITTIIPTLAEGRRRTSLLRAIASIHAACAIPVRVLVVVNGQRFEPSLLAELKARTDLELIQIGEGSQIRAQHTGRLAVDTPFFSFLDDDDEYLPGALDVRMRLLLDDPGAAIAVTNGYLSCGGVDEVCYSRLERVAANPLYELFQENWLHNCNHLFRTAKVPPAHFGSAPALMEWTWLAYRLVLEGQTVVASNALGFRYYDTPGSLSKSDAFFDSRVAIYGRMLALNPERRIRRLLRRRLCSAWHDIAMHEHGLGHRGAAMQAHLRSLSCHWSGLRFLPSSRHLLRR